MDHTCVIGESDPFVAYLLQRFAEQSGLEVVHATGSQEVLDLIRQSVPSVIILDAELPGELRGWEIPHILHAEPTTASVPVISCSWLSEARAGELMGPLAGHLQKPELHFEDFLMALRNAGVTVSGSQEMNQQKVTNDHLSAHSDEVSIRKNIYTNPE